MASEHFAKRKVEFIATIKYRTGQEGGLTTPAMSGYRPQVKFPFSDYQTSGQQAFIGVEKVYPGDPVNAEIKILSVNYFANSLTEGMEFEVREGSRIVAIGRINQIVNDGLRK